MPTLSERLIALYGPLGARHFVGAEIAKRIMRKWRQDKEAAHVQEITDTAAEVQAKPAADLEALLAELGGTFPELEDVRQRYK